MTRLGDNEKLKALRSELRQQGMHGELDAKHQEAVKYLRQAIEKYGKTTRTGRLRLEMGFMTIKEDRKTKERSNVSIVALSMKQDEPMDVTFERGRKVHTMPLKRFLNKKEVVMLADTLKWYNQREEQQNKPVEKPSFSYAELHRQEKEENV